MKNIIQGTPIFLSGDVDEKMLQTLDSGLKEALTKDVPSGGVTIFLTTHGGNVGYSGAIAERLAIITKDLPIKMIGATFVHSAGVQIFLSVPKEQRFVTRGCQIMIHPAKRGLKYLEGATGLTEIERRLQEELMHVHSSQRAEERLIRQLVRITGIPRAKLLKLYAKSHRFSAHDAVKYHLATAIVG